MAEKSDFARLREYLAAENLRPGDRLPAERQLAEALGLTRARLRTSLARLEREGLIRRHVGQGTFLTEPPVAPEVTAFPEIDTSPAEILEARLALEPQIAALAAQRASGLDLEKLSNIIEMSRGTISWADWNRLDRAFHLTLAQIAGNRLLCRLLETIQASMTLRNWGDLSENAAAVARRDLATDEHAAILAAIRARAPRQAAEEMQRHLTAVHATLLALPGSF